MEPWRARLAEGDVEAAWSLFIERYRALIVATIRNLVEPDDEADVFSHVCQSLSARELARLRRYDSDSPAGARFSTWLVAVVHNLVIDERRHRAGRRRVRTPAGLTVLQQRIFTSVFVEHRSHAETYEIIRGAATEGFTFACFLKELAETYRTVERARPRGVMRYLAVPPAPGPVRENVEPHVDAFETARRIDDALRDLPGPDRLALKLFVVEGLTAADVARIVGWPSAKMVYNRVYRALQRLRTTFQRDGIGPADL